MEKTPEKDNNQTEAEDLGTLEQIWSDTLLTAHQTVEITQMTDFSATDRGYSEPENADFSSTGVKITSL